jgi:hypothetical protein
MIEHHCQTSDDRVAGRRKLREELADLKNVAIAELENRGYEVRGKTAGDIRRILKRHPTKRLPIPK